MDAASAQAGFTGATWFWLLVPMLSCVALSIATWIGAAGRRRGRTTRSS